MKQPPLVSVDLAAGLCSNHHIAAIAMPEKQKKLVWPTAVALAVAAYAICKALDASASLTTAAVLIALYLPSYLDGAEYTGERYWPAFADFGKKHLSGIPMTLEYEEPVDPKKQYMFCSHPHGLLSAHHGILMMGSSTPCS